ncbi:hypothetical protein B0H19DRAFT_1266816 [Mycena capillaripes]|nr:hypothetical protein B0H19DRAFT_1266816 [Mycena capillaripes]
MSTILSGQSDGISIGGLTLSSLDVRRFLIGAGAISGFLLLSYLALLSVPKLARWTRKARYSRYQTVTPAMAHLLRPAAARLRPDVSLPEPPFASRTHPRPRLMAAVPKAHTMRPIREVYRYSGNWLAGLKKPSGPQQLVDKRSRTVQPKPIAHQVPQRFVEQVDQQQGSTDSSQVPREQLLAQRDSAVYLHQTADVVVGAHPDAQPLEKRFVDHHQQVSFPWVSCTVVNKADFKLGLIPTLNVTASVSPVPIVKASPLPTQDSSPTALFHWGSVTHTLEKPLRGNKLQRAFAQSVKHNVNTNVVFHKTSPFYTPSAAEKENVYGSPQAVRALV